MAWLSACAVSGRAPQRDDPGVMRSGQLILQSDDHSITFGDLQRQHLDVLRESTGERTQLGHPGAAHSSELGFKGADALLQGLGRRSPVADFGSTELGEKIGRTV